MYQIEVINKQCVSYSNDNAIQQGYPDTTPDKDQVQGSEGCGERTIPSQIRSLHELPRTSPLPMIHCGGIQTDDVYLAVSPDTPSSIQDIYPDADVSSKAGSSFSIGLLHNTIRLTGQKMPDGRYRVEYLWVDLQRLRYGHSGQVIESDCDLHLALSILNYLINKLLEQSSQDRCIPGLVKGCKSYWSMLEIPLQVHDPGGKLLRALSNAKHSRIHKAPLYKIGQTVSMKGSNLKICVYRKDIQLEDQYHMHVGKNDKDVLRLEVTVKGRILTEFFGLQPKERLKTFGGDSLYKVFLKAIKGLRGGFRIQQDEPNLDKVTNLARFMANILMDARCDLNLNELIDLYKASAICEESTLKELARNSRKCLQASSDFLLSEIFPDDKPPRSAKVTPQRKLKDGKGQSHGRRAKASPYPETRGIPIDPRIAVAYRGVDIIFYEHFEYSKETGKPHPEMNPVLVIQENARRGLTK